MVGGNGGRGEIKMVSASTPSANEPAKDVVLVLTVQLKPMLKAQISGRMISSVISDVATASVYFDNYYYEFITRNDGFWRAPEIDFRYETEARIEMVDFKFDALYR